jgi:zona occludens toxin
MVMNCFSGTPGSGKSLHLARECMDYLRVGKNVICNFACYTKVLDRERNSIMGKIFRRFKKYGVYIFKSNKEINVRWLVSYAFKYHKYGIENQTLIAIDECQILFNSRDWNDEYRKLWCLFFAQHRKLGFNIIMVTQSMRSIDKQIRSNFENEIVHRNINQYKFLWLLPKKTFVAVTRWIGIREKVSHEFFTYSEKCGNFYDSYATLGAFDGIEIEDVSIIDEVPGLPVGAETLQEVGT